MPPTTPNNHGSSSHDQEAISKILVENIHATKDLVDELVEYVRKARRGVGVKYELDEDAVAVLLEYVEEALVEIAEVLDGPQHQEGATWTTSGMHMGRAPRFALNKQRKTLVDMRRALRDPIRCKDDVLGWPWKSLDAA